MSSLLGALALLAASAACYAAARRSLAACHEGSRAVAVALAMAFVAVIPAQACRALGQLGLGLPGGLALCAGAAAVIAIALGRRAPVTRVDGDANAPPLRPDRITTAALAALWAAVTVLSWRSDFFDESVHWQNALQIARGVVPPRVVFVPDAVYHSHWAVDGLMAALVGAGFTAPQAEDLVTSACFALFLTLAWQLGARVGGPRGGAVMAIGLPLVSSPLAWPLIPLGVLSLGSPYPPSWSELLQVPNPPLVNFFQHAQGLGMPLFLAALLIWAPLRRAPAKTAVGPSRVVGGVLVALLSLCNVVYFQALGLVLGASALFELARTRAVKPFLVDLAALLAALAGAVVLGGVLAEGPAVVLGSFFRDPPVLRALHHVVAFGLPLLLGGFFWRSFPPLSAGLAATAALLFAVPNVVVLRDHWDIVKLYDVAVLCAALLLFAGVAKRGGAALAIVPVTSALSVAWLVVNAGAPALGVPERHELVLRDDVEALRRAFTAHIPPRARVLTDDPGLGRETGFLTPGFVPVASTFDPYPVLHLDREAVLADAHARERAVRALRDDDLDLLRIDFVIATPSLVQGASADGRAALGDAARFELVESAGQAVLLRRVRQP
ncbi:MAG: hypothetical protein A2138_03550 [Deltaproteobacteria bacterium RBG_16_71_12]|nr:MAG: hypothetical protein A2138_03550 [Deltaproteobacteria bacterium RBG_16_71_12]